MNRISELDLGLRVREPGERSVRQSSMRCIIGAAICALLVNGCSHTSADTSSDAKGVESPRELLADERYGCGGDYPASALDGPLGAERGSHPANRKLQRLLETDDEFSDLPKEGWRRVNLTRTKAVFVVDSWSGHRFPYQEMVLERTNGRWRWGGGGDCRPLAAGDEGSGAIWHLQGGPESVDEGDARLDLMLQEMECSGTRKPPRKAIHPEVIYGETYTLSSYESNPSRVSQRVLERHQRSTPCNSMSKWATDSCSTAVTIRRHLAADFERGDFTQAQLDDLSEMIARTSRRIALPPTKRDDEEL